MNKEEMKALLKKYDEAYYNQQESLITDAEYDKLKEEYLALGGEDFVSGEIKQGNKVKHTFHVSSLAKVKASEKDKLRKEIERLFPCIIQPKLDGMTLVEYKDNLVTRGNGEIGEDKTDKKTYMEGIGNFFDMPVRGEALMTKADFEKINKELGKNGQETFVNTRNAISGMLNRKNITPKGITFYAYYVNGIKNPLEQIKILKENGYNTVESYIPESVDDAIVYLENFDKDSLEFDIDGLVIKSLQNKDFGQTEHHPLDSIAYKFDVEEKETKLLDIEWNVGKTGIVSPVAIFKPVYVEGSTISRATLHNMAYISALGLTHINDNTTVTVCKANSIIPRVLATKNCDKGKLVTYPSICPVCGSQLVKEGDLLYCKNKTCKEKLIAQAVHMASRECLNIEGLSEATIRKMYDYLENNNRHPHNFIFPLYFDCYDILALEGFAEKSAKKLDEEIDDKLNVPFANFLNACNIPLLGKTASKTIAKEYTNLDEFLNDIESDNGKKLLSIDGFGEELYKSIKENYKNILLLDSQVYSIIYDKKEIDINSSITNKTFVVTGDVHIFKNRKELQNKIESLGGKVTGSVSKKTDYLINNDIESTSSKNKKAKELNIPIITEEDFMQLIGEN